MKSILLSLQYESMGKINSLGFVSNRGGFWSEECWANISWNLLKVLIALHNSNHLPVLWTYWGAFRIPRYLSFVFCRTRSPSVEWWKINIPISGISGAHTKAKADCQLPVYTKTVPRCWMASSAQPPIGAVQSPSADPSAGRVPSLSMSWCAAWRGDRTSAGHSLWAISWGRAVWTRLQRQRLKVSRDLQNNPRWFGHVKNRKRFIANTFLICCAYF